MSNVGSDRKRPLAYMHRLAERVVDDLRPYCERIAIAGSVRRQKPECGDIEIVCRPRFEDRRKDGDLFGATERVNLLDEHVLADIRYGYRLDKNGRTAAGPRYKRLSVVGSDGQPVGLDLFSVLQPAQWGLLMMVRTGPAPFSARAVTPYAPGWMRSDCRVREGAVWRGDELIEMPEEEDFFRFVGREWIAPEDRR